jgi:hypothetical protein
MVLKIITSIYDLNYEEGRGGMRYKSFPLLTQTIRNILFDEFEYVIYTDKHTYDLYLLGDIFKRDNITIKFQELNSPYYLEKINPIRDLKFKEGEIYDRIYCVKNYIEVILNKIKFLLDETEENKNVVWIDSGLFGTSCHDGWRDYMNVLAHSKLFLDKINEKMNEHGFISLRGESIQVNYELRDRMNAIYNTDFKLVPGALFGGNITEIQKVLSDYLNVFNMYLETYNGLISEQEVLAILTHRNNTKFFNFGDWNDFQRGILEIMDKLDTEKYILEKCYE